MIIWDNFKLQNSNATITLSATTYDISGVTHDALSIDKPILSPSFAGASTIQGDLVLNNQRIVPESVTDPGAGIHIQPSTISIWGSTISIDGSTVDFRSSSITNSGQAYFRQLESTGSTIHSLTVTAAASITQATITTLNVTNPVTLPVGSKIEGEGSVDFPAIFEVFGETVNNNLKVTILNTTGWPLTISKLGSTSDFTIEPYDHRSEDLGHYGPEELTFNYTINSFSGSVDILVTNLNPYPNPWNVSDLDENAILITTRTIDRPSWLWKVLYYKKENNIETGAILFSLFDNSATNYDYECNKIAQFYQVHKYQIGVCDEFNQRVPKWGTLQANGYVDFTTEYGHCNLSVAGIILFKTKPVQQNPS